MRKPLQSLEEWSPSVTVEGHNSECGKSYRRILVAIGLLNIFSAVLFLYAVSKPVYDDPYNMLDVHAYAKNGFSPATIRAQRNPPGPVAFVWMAMAVRALGGDELRDARIASLLSWILLVAGVLIGARFAQTPHLWYAALLATIVFPHSPTATATALTEGPALFLAILGVLMWTESVYLTTITWASFLTALLGGLLMGLAAVCRQYFLALLPSAVLFAAYVSREENRRRKPPWVGLVVASLVAAALPVVCLMLVWNGLSSPGMAMGTSYSNWKAGVGINFFRPVVALFYCLFYLLPFTFPAMKLAHGRLNQWLFSLALALGALAAFHTSTLLQPGPLHSFIQAFGRIPLAREIIFGAIVSITIYNAISFACLILQKRQALTTSPLFLFALLVLALFVLEQVGVGGNLPFYDRYMIQVAPFLGILAFYQLPKLSISRLTVLLLMFAVGQIMLWRYAFIS